METLKQIIYREEDGVIMIIPQNEETQIIPRFFSELSSVDKLPLESLRDFCLTKVNNLIYIVYSSDVDRLDIQPNEGEVICLVVSELEEADKLIVDSALNKCTELLNKNN